MKLLRNGQEVGTVQTVEIKEEAAGGSSGRITFMAPFDFDWTAAKADFLELKNDDERFMLPTIRSADKGSTGTFVSADYKPL